MKCTTLATAIALALGAGTVQAANSEDAFSIRGYATLGVVYSDEDQADFVSHILTQSKGAGFSDKFSFDPDSKLGVQLSLDITSHLSAVVQLISEASANNSWNNDVNKKYRPSLEWANLSYRVTDDLTVRAGRIVLPLQTIAEYRKVGFANHWVRPPTEVYGYLTFASSDGADVSYRSKVGMGYNTVRINYGVQATRAPTIGSDVQALGFSNIYETGALSVRGGYMNLHFKSPQQYRLGQLVDPFIALADSLPESIGATAATEAVRVRDTYDPARRNRADFFNLGAMYDTGRWFAGGEVLLLITADGPLRNTSSGYLTGGYRWNKLTPYATAAFIEPKKFREPGIPLAGLPVEAAVFGGLINEVIATAFGSNYSQQGYSLGLRWDIAPKFAIKTQYDLINPEVSGFLLNVQPGFKLGSSVSVFSVSLDYMF